MLVYMTHPNHGTHIAYSLEEVERCRANGWTVREDKPQAPDEPKKVTTLRLAKRKGN